MKIVKIFTYLICFIGALLPIYFLSIQQEISFLQFICDGIKHPNQFYVLIVICFLPYMVIASFQMISKSKSGMILAIILSACETLYGLYFYYDFFITKKSNSAGFLIIIIPVIQLATSVAAVALIFLVLGKKNFSNNKINRTE